MKKVWLINNATRKIENFIVIDDNYIAPKGFSISEDIQKESDTQARKDFFDEKMQIGKVLTVNEKNSLSLKTEGK